MNNPITKITIEMGGQSVELTVEQAKKLHGDLEAVFGEKTKNHYIPYTQPDPIWPSSRPFWWNDRITCGTDNMVRLQVS